MDAAQPPATGTLDRRRALLAGSGLVTAGVVGDIPQPTTPDQLRGLADTLDGAFEYLPARQIAYLTHHADKHGRAILADCDRGSRDYVQACAAVGMLGATRAAALFDLGDRIRANTLYEKAFDDLGRGDHPVAQLWVLGRQVIHETLQARPVLAVTLATHARVFAARHGLDGHPAWARLLVQAEARALIAIRQVARAESVLREAADVMTAAPSTRVIGLHQQGMSAAEFSTSMATRYNELADAEPRQADVYDDRAQAASYIIAAWPDLDQAGATGLRSYVRLELARVVLDDDPKMAAELLIDVADVSQQRPVDHLIGQYHTVARTIADRDIGLGRQLTDRLREWRGPTAGGGITRRFFA
ncbi:hypothetical protein [Frankia sp. CiP3]|uniref:hypothetical protein n=1 Tax=Frankia sp. CiP3 TaxID=2880971 RepID=UPI001EF49E4F|nr:hypothetical protein [Frankia sp. CiP3]